MEEMTVILEPELSRKLHALAREEARPAVDLLREALVTYLDAKSQPPLLSLGIAEDDELTGENSEDWLRAHWHPQ